jgi:hypothetical protein
MLSFLNTPSPEPRNPAASILDHAASRSATTGRCRRPSTFPTMRASLAPLAPRIAVCGEAQDPVAGQFLRGSNLRLAFAATPATVTRPLHPRPTRSASLPDAIVDRPLDDVGKTRDTCNVLVTLRAHGVSTDADSFLRSADRPQDGPASPGCMIHRHLETRRGGYAGSASRHCRMAGLGVRPPLLGSPHALFDAHV